MVKKPRSRKRESRRKYYAVATVAAVAVLAFTGWYFLRPVDCTSGPYKYATIGTTMGTFKAELFPGCAPKTVANFVSLSQSGFYDNLTWHRIVKGFVIQTGDPFTVNGGGTRADWGRNGSSTSVPFESSDSLHNYAGYLAMASTAARVGGTSQFYVNLVNNTSLDGSYAVFGKVISGFDVVVSIGNVPVYTNQSSPYYNQPITPVLVTNVTISDQP